MRLSLRFAPLLAVLVGCGSDPAPTDSAPPYPTESAKLRPWLDAGSYQSWPHESVVHLGDGPHNFNVKTYLSPELDASLKAKNKEHPRGATMVKEIYGSGTTTVVGFAYATKLAATSNGGDNWYWYEIQDKSAGTVKGDGKGVTTCKACHAGGVDFVQSQYPLR